ncbi:Pyridoxal phosphate (active vitamin B6) biosynthesis PdxA [Candidatus Omnitrophus magneticus]|uniref:Pyridoxal phosphate (Active vitamin B6) biosynthesis PdxA n=1 Tax=Candidatus Omnitrophus magneticus TaxID=1609969 RepID=A0A0F0CMB4_9BACT|nr:Pyridoxal phosphate (active vitamin B6) biosynthesis PdxA [Candidatus Omnitrophus magneticus]
MGDPAGIGPEVIVKSLASPGIKGLANFVIVGDRILFENIFSSMGVKESFYPARIIKESFDISEGDINILEPAGPLSCPIVTGAPSLEGARKAFESVTLAAEIMRSLDNNIKTCLVTAPLDKGLISKVYNGFIGHTEYLKELFSAKFVVMALLGERLKVIPVTRHVPFSEVSALLNQDLIIQTIKEVVLNAEWISGKKNARIGVAALNPHAGERGKIGDEEINIIKPAVEKAKEKFSNIEGPIPSDVIFYKALKGEIDIVVGMYHDQCLAPFKMVDFDNGVNVTLGLGYIRTSPDHGTAFDIAGKGIAKETSMVNAIKLAIQSLTRY